MTNIFSAAARPQSGLVVVIQRIIATLDCIPLGFVALAARVFPAALFWQSGATKIAGWHLKPSAVALFQNPLDALWVVVLFVVIQQLEGHIVAPQIFSHALRINPVLVIVALLFGYAIYGIVGALMALPVAAVIRETLIYLRRHVVLEPWRAQPPPPT